MKNEQKKGDIKALSEGFFTPRTISEMEFRQLQIWYFQTDENIEFHNYKLDISEISPEDFESCKDFFEKYKDKCLMQLSNYKEINEKIIARLQNMEDNYGTWEGLKEESLQCNDDGYNAEKGN